MVPASATFTVDPDPSHTEASHTRLSHAVLSSLVRAAVLSYPAVRCLGRCVLSRMTVCYCVTAGCVLRFAVPARGPPSSSVCLYVPRPLLAPPLELVSIPVQVSCIWASTVKLVLEGRGLLTPSSGTAIYNACLIYGSIVYIER